MRTHLIVVLVLACAYGAFGDFSRASAQAPPAVSVLTNRNDNARTGTNLRETVLDVHALSSGQFGLLFSLPVDGYVYAQPLYVPGVTSGAGAYNVLVVATEHNSVYAFDADGGRSAPLWQTNLGPAVAQDPDHDPANALIPECQNLTPEIGITSTPVIDPSTGTIYVVAKTRDGDGVVRQRLHALALADGSDKASVEIQAAVTRNEFTTTFDPVLNLNRPGLLLVNGAVYLAFGSHCDYGDYRGWVIAYDAATLTRTAVFAVSPLGEKGSIWQSGTGLSADAAGNIYTVTSNGTFSVDGSNLSDSIIRLVAQNGTLTAADYFTPNNQAYLESFDVDLGSGGALLVPGTNLAVTGGKQGVLYVVDRSSMGGFDPNEDRIVQSFQATDVPFVNNIHSTPIYWMSPQGGRLFLWGENESLKAFSFDGSQFDPTPVARSVVQAPPNAMPGGFLSLSANGSTAGSGVLWASIARDEDATLKTVDGVLRAFDAENVAHELWNSDLDPQDQVGSFAKFCTPTIANGKVYLATFSGAVRVYGLQSAPPPGPAVPNSPNPQNGTTWVTMTPNLSWSSEGATSYEIRLGTTNPPPTVVADTPDFWYAPPPLNGATTYFWQIVASNSNGTTRGPIWSFTTEPTPTPPPPAAPDGPAPADGATAVSRSPTLTWHAPNATSYDVKFGTSNPPLVVVSTGEATASYSPSTLAYSTTYFWQIVAHNDGGTTSGTVWSFTTAVAPPGVPVASNPPDGATNVATTQALTWSASGATSYEVAFGASNPPPQVSTGQATGSYLPPLANGTTYFWQIVARNGSGTTAGPVWSFTTASASPPDVPGNPSPVNLASNAATPATLTWMSSTATSYDVKFGTSNPPPTVSTAQSSASYRPAALANGTTYFWQIIAHNSAGDTAGPVWSFTTVASGAGLPGPTDFDGDRKADVTVFRPSTGRWYVLESHTGNTTSVGLSLGISGDILVPGDYDGDGTSDAAVYRPADATWHILQSSSNSKTPVAVPWGEAGDKPVAGDYDGDGKTDPAVYRPSSGGWIILKSSTNYTTFAVVSWGLTTDVPVPGDYDGDGKTDIAVYRPSSGGWYILKSSTNNSSSIALSWGLGSDVPVPGDYDGDGKIDPAVYRASTGSWCILKSRTTYSTSIIVPWGLSTDTPVPGDFDGDGKTDPAVFRASTGAWYILKSSADYATYAAALWGFSTDVPVLRCP